MTAIQETADILASTLANRKEFAIMGAIDSVMGDGDWCLEDVINRSEIVVEADNTESFSFDGVKLLEFGLIECTIENTDNTTTFEATQPIRKLYEH